MATDDPLREFLDSLNKISSFHKEKSNPVPSTLEEKRGDIKDLPLNEILRNPRFTPEERAAEYRRRGKSPSGVIDGVYNDAYRGNEAYNDSLRDWEANA